MGDSEATYTFSLDTRRAKKDGSYPLKLRVFFNKQKKRYSTGLSMTTEDFQKSYLDKPILKKHKQYHKQIKALEQELDEILKNIGVFTYEKFEARLQTKSSNNDLFSAFDLYIQQLRNEKRISTASSYQQAKTSIQKFTTKKVLPFTEVTSGFLQRYENKMVSDGRSVSTVGIYLRYVRNLFNIAIREEIVKKDYYPFGKGKYQIPNTPKTYKALTFEQVNALNSVKVEVGTNEQFFRDLWFFSYYGNGINTKDLALLKFKNIQDNIIHFKRAKTILTNRTAPEGEIPLIDPIKEIIERCGNDPSDKENYIFPILQPGYSDEKIKAVIHQTNKLIKRYINKVAAKAGVTDSISAQTARHTFTTVMVQAGVPLPMISQRLTHGSTNTTDKYIGKIDTLKDFEISNLLIPDSNTNADKKQETKTC